MMGRVALATFVFLSVTVLAFCALSGAGFALLEALDGFHQSMALGFALVIYSPMLVIFLVVSIAGGLWTSHRVYYRRRNTLSDRDDGEPNTP